MYQPINSIETGGNNSDHGLDYLILSMCWQTQIGTCIFYNAIVITVKPRLQATAFRSGILSFPAIVTSLKCLDCVWLVSMVKPSVQSTDLDAN